MRGVTPNLASALAREPTSGGQTGASVRPLSRPGPDGSGGIGQADGFSLAVPLVSGAPRQWHKGVYPTSRSFMKSVNGRLKPLTRNTPNDYSNHFLLVAFSERLGGAESESAAEQALREAGIVRTSHVSVEDNGNFVFDIPEAHSVLGPVDITVKGPDGGALLSQSFAYTALNASIPTNAEDSSAPLHIPVDPRGPVELAATVNPQPYKLRGRAVRFSDGKPLSGHSLFLYASYGASPQSASEPRVLGSVKSDSQGYFALDVPGAESGIELQAAHILVAGVEQPHPLSLSDGSPRRLTSPQIVVVQAEVKSELEESGGDCACQELPTPRLPDAEDLVSSPAFSDDLGQRCVDFTTPNRALEEFSFYQVVRTTEPEFKKVPFTHPPLLRRAHQVATAAVSYEPQEESVGIFARQLKSATLQLEPQQAPGSSPSARLAAPHEGAPDTRALDTRAPQTGDAAPPPTSSGEEGPKTASPAASSNGSALDAEPQAEPVMTRGFYEYMQRSIQENGRFWIFSTDPLTYHAHHISMLPPPGREASLDPILIWKKALAELHGFLYERAPRGNELVSFLALIDREFRAVMHRRPSTPLELEQFVTSHFAKGSRGRHRVDGAHPIDWDETPTLFLNTTIAHGHILHLKQVWKADGYSLGDLLYSLPLAPCQKKQIAIFDWDRNEAAGREESLTVDERLSAFLDRDRDVLDVVNTALSESLQGGSTTEVESKSKSFGLGLGQGVAASAMPQPGVFLGVSGGFSAGFGSQSGSSLASSSAWQNAARSLTGSSINQLRDSLMQGASSVRNQRSTVIQTVSQGESMNVQTEVIANHNHCHAVTMEYFEVLRHFAIEQRLADVQECLFIPLDMAPFNAKKILRFQDELRRAIRNPRLRQGLAATESIVRGGLPSGIRADEPLQELYGELNVSLVLSRPEDESGEDDPVSQARWSALSALLGPWTVSRVRAAFEAKRQQEREELWQKEILPELLGNFISNLEFGYEDENGAMHPLELDSVVEVDPSASYTRQGGKRALKSHRLRAQLKNYRQGELLRIVVRLHPKRQSLRRSDIAAFYIRNPFELPAGSRVLFEGGHLRYRSEHLQEYLFNRRNYRDDIDSRGDRAVVLTPLNERELHYPAAEAYEAANRLIAHLNDHLEFYHKAIWYQMDADRRAALLDGYIAPNSGGRSVTSVVENRLVGVVSNNLVMPVARGYRLDPTYKQSGSDPVDLLAHYSPTTPIAPFRLSVPTRGVYAEAVMGQCNSCEKIDESRHWRFTEVPCGDQPTAIGPIDTGTRRADPGSLAPTPLPNSLVSIQNAPQAPAPQGLGPALEAISNSEAFGNVTGLEGNQKTLMEAFSQVAEGAREGQRINVQAAQNYAQMAKELAMHASAIRNTDKILSRVDDLESDGSLSKEDANALRQKALRGMLPKGDAPDEAGEGGGSAGQEETARFIEMLETGLSTLKKGYGKSFSGGVTTPSGSSLNLDVGAGPSDTGTAVALNRRIELIRTEETTQSTIGEYTVPGTTFSGYMLEPAGPSTTAANQDQRIPAGTYQLTRYNSPRHGLCFLVSNSQVSQSRRILIHKGNTPGDTEGCLLPGTTKATDSVGNSTPRFDELLAHFESEGWEGAELSITESFPAPVSNPGNGSQGN